MTNHLQCLFGSGEGLDWMNPSSVLGVLVVLSLFPLMALANASERIPAWRPAHTSGTPSGGGVGSPSGRYLGWPLPVLIVTLILGLIPAVMGCKGDPVVFVVVAVLNPVLWCSIYPLWHLGRLACPHCRKSASMSLVSNAAVGSPLVCPFCNNIVSKPAG
jgi:hypothetical protein